MTPPLHLLRPEVRAERAYRVPTEDYPAKLDQNESPFDAPEAVKRAAAEAFLDAEWNRYPDDRPHRLIAALEAKWGLPAGSVIVGRGSNELTHTLGLCFVASGTRVVLPHPMFALYASVVRMHGGAIVEVDPGKDFGHDAAAIAEAAEAANAALTIVTTPNNPTGQRIPYEGLEELARRVPGWLVVDEAYHEFVEGRTAVELIADYPNVLVMRTFSKAMGLAGVRLGVLAGHPEAIAEIEKARLPFLIDRMGEAVGLAMLEQADTIAEHVAVLKAERQRVQDALAADARVEVVPGTANFFLLRTALAPQALIGRLTAHGVRIRDVSGYPALRGWVRVSVGTPAENDAFLGALGAVLAEGATPAPAALTAR